MARITDRLLVQRANEMIVFIDDSSGAEVVFPVEIIPNVRAVLRYLHDPQAHAVEPSPDGELSRMLFEARELIEMFNDITESRSGKTDHWSRRVRDEIDAYRAMRGWSPHGFGGEDGPSVEATGADEGNTQ